LTTRSTEYTTCYKICCGNSYPANVIICIPSTLVEASPGPISYIRGTIGCSCGSSYNVCGQQFYRYIITYDDEQLVEDAVLVGSNITGVICDDCLIQYIDDNLSMLSGSGLQADGLSAAGTTQGAGTQIENVINRFVGVSTGVNDACVLPDVETWLPDKVVVQSFGGTLQVFPFSGQEINGLGANVAVNITTTNSKIFYKITDVFPRWMSVG